MPLLKVDIPETIPIEEARLELAIGLFRAGRVSQGEAAAIAGYSRATFIELLSSRGVSFTNITVDDLEKEFASWRESESPTAHQ